MGYICCHIHRQKKMLCNIVTWKRKGVLSKRIVLEKNAFIVYFVKSCFPFDCYDDYKAGTTHSSTWQVYSTGDQKLLDIQPHICILEVILAKQPKPVFMTFEVSEIYTDISRVPQVRVDRYFSSTYTNSTIPCTNLHFIFVLLITNEIRSNTVYNWYSRWKVLTIESFIKLNKQLRVRKLLNSAKLISSHRLNNYTVWATVECLWPIV